MNATTKPAATILDLDAMLDTAIDSVETVPDFVTPPPGIYLLGVKECKTEPFTSKDQKTKGFRIRITYTIMKTIEVSNDEQPYPDGSLFSESFMGTDEGLKYFKKAAMNILGVNDFSGATIKDVIGGVTGAEFEARITIRKTKGEGGTVYENINVRATKPVVAQDD